MVAMTLSVVLARSEGNHNKPLYLIVDECGDVVDSCLETFATQARKKLGGTVLAHQAMSQIKDRRMADVLSSHVGVKLYGRLSLSDATSLSREIKVAPSLLNELRPGDATRPAEFVLAVSGRGGVGHRIEVPMLVLERQATLSTAEWVAVLEDSRQRFGTPVAGEVAGDTRTSRAKPAGPRTRWSRDGLEWD